MSAEVPAAHVKTKKNPKKHGPYFKLNYQHQGKSKTIFVREKHVKKITKENKNYKVFKELTQMWITLEIERSNLALKEENNNIVSQNPQKAQSD
jgi:hypothetical protein